METAVIDAEEASRVFKVLAVNTRVRMIQLLKPGPLCVNALAEKLGITPAAVSQHLRILRDARLVTAAKHGYYVHYRLETQTLERWRQTADDVLNSEPLEPPCAVDPIQCCPQKERTPSCVPQTDAARNRMN